MTRIADVRLGPLGSVGRVGERLIGVTNRSLSMVWRASRSERWYCPCCDHRSAFAPTLNASGARRHSRCPYCGANERHRLAAHAFNETIGPYFAGRLPRILHVAPEPSIASSLRSLGGTYETGDLFMPGVDHVIDLTRLPFEDASYDLVWASHVLAVIRDDRAALAEIRRVLRPGGVAVLPIPILGSKTIDYPHAVAGECDNWHAPGWDYEERFLEFFDRVTWLRSEDVPAQSQTFLYEDRSKWPTRSFPYRSASAGALHGDGIPMCWVDRAP